jgi:4-hydroxythreonine-4-phosphate dehydrogenase
MPRIPIIALTPGEPGGVGPDLCIQIAQDPAEAVIVIIADPKLLNERAKTLGLDPNFSPWPAPQSARRGFFVYPVNGVRGTAPGKIDIKNARYVLDTLEQGVDGCLRRDFDALVTGPVHKGALNDAGFDFTGHTEYLAQRTGVDHTVMMLACPTMRVALVTTHLALANVPQAVTQTRLARAIEILDDELRATFGIPQPEVAVCGLNPHAGESGHFGREEIEVIIPVIQALRARGLRLRGPLPADTAFIPSQLRDVDAVLAMYHDQGLPVLKHHDFARAVNITLGLPFIRTSVDHGTALELAGTGTADATSLHAAITMAIELAVLRDSVPRH